MPMDGNDGEGRMMRTSPVGKIKPFAKQTVPFKPLKWPATPSLQRIFHLMLALCQMTVNHNVILFCQIYYLSLIHI